MMWKDDWRFYQNGPSIGRKNDHIFNDNCPYSHCYDVKVWTDARWACIRCTASSNLFASNIQWSIEYLVWTLHHKTFQNIHWIWFYIKMGEDICEKEPISFNKALKIELKPLFCTSCGAQLSHYIVQTRWEEKNGTKINWNRLCCVSLRS